MARDKWTLDYRSLQNARQRGNADPPGFKPLPSGSLVKAHDRTVKTTQAQDDQMNLKLKRAWDVALGPAKTVPMNAFMLWMSGNSVQIFSVMITSMLFMQPIRAIMNVSETFKPYEPTTKSKEASQALMFPKTVFFALQLLTIALGLYKCQAMGLLPTASSDWLAFLTHKQPLEHAFYP